MSASCACKGCQKRFVGCHASCEDYKKFKEELKKQNDFIYRKKQVHPFGMLSIDKYR